MQDIRVCTADAPLVLWKDSIEATLAETGEILARVTGNPSAPNFQEDGRLAGVIVTSKKWQVGRTIRVKFTGGDSRVIERIKPYFLEWTKYANLKFSRSLGYTANPNGVVEVEIPAKCGYTAI